jgi:WD40 repeat protein
VRGRNGQAPPPASWRVGDVIDDRYAVTGPPVAGPVGTVHRVRHLMWDVDLAVTTPLPRLLADPAARERLERQARAWALLGPHPNVCRCYYVRTIDGIPRIFSEDVAEGSLADRVDDRTLYHPGPDSALVRIIDLAVQVARALGHVHESGFAHQDVRPAAVLLARPLPGDDGMGPGSVRLGGFVTPAGPDPGSDVEGPHPPRRDPYAPPERVETGLSSTQGDVWSFAVTLLELFAGDIVWGAGPDAFARHLARGRTGTAPPPIPGAVADLLLRCLSHDPGDRPGSMALIAAELDEARTAAAGSPYPYPACHAGARADGLTDTALALCDVGEEEAGAAELDAALSVSPLHPEATYNASLLRWRRGAATDEAAVAAGEAVVAGSGSWRPRYLLAQIHLERGDVASALALLEDSSRRADRDGEAGGRRDAETLRRRAEAGEVTDARCVDTYEVSLSPWGARRPGRGRGAGNDEAAVRLDATGRTALTGEADGRVRLWDLPTGRCRVDLAGHRARVHSVDLAPDGRHAVSTSGDNTVRWWDVDRGVCLMSRRLEPATPHGVAVATVRMTAGGASTLAAGQDRAVRLLDSATGQDLLALHGHTGGVTVAVASTDGRLVLSGGWDRAVRVWDAEEGRCLHALTGHDRPVTAGCLTPSGHRAASGDSGGTILLWDTTGGERASTLAGHTGQVTALALDPAGRLALSAAVDGTVRVWEVDTGRCLRTFRGHHGPVADVRLAPDGTTALSAGQDGTARRWLLPGRYTAPMRPSRPPRRAVTAVGRADVRDVVARADAALCEGRPRAAHALLSQARTRAGPERDAALLDAWWRLAAACRLGEARAAWPVRELTGHTAYVTSVALSPADGTAVSGGADGTVRVWEVRTGRCLRILTGHTGAVTSVGVTADGERAVSAGQDGSVRLWRMSSGECLHALPSGGHGATFVRSRADAEVLLVGYADGTVTLLDTTGGRTPLEGHTDHVRTGWLAPDGSLAVTAGYDRTLRLWRTATGECLRVLAGHADVVMSLDVTGDGTRAVSTGGPRDRTLRMWDLGSGGLERIVDGGGGILSAVRFIPSAAGRVAVTAGSDAAVRVWDVGTGRCLRTLVGHAGGVLAVAADPSGRHLVSGGSDGSLRLWELDWELTPPDGE